MAEEDDAFAEALGGDAGSADEAGEGEGDLDPLAQEMLRMMEEEGEPDDAGPQEDVDRMMESEMLKAMEDEGGVGGAGLGAEGRLGALDLGGGGAAPAGGGVPPSVARLMEVPLTVTIVLGTARKTLEEVLELGEQSLVELEKQVGDPVEVMVNGKPFARGEVVTVSENFGVRITELLPGGLSM